MRSAETFPPGARDASAAAASVVRAIACLVLAFGLGACAGVGGGPPGAAGGDAAKAPAAGATAQKPALIPDLDPAVINAFETALGDLHAGRTAEAEKGFLALTKSHPELGGPHANLGIVYRQTGRPEQAITELEQAVHCNPQQPVFWNQLGIAYRQQGQFAKAREAYEHAIALDPGYPAPILNLGILFDLYLWDGKRALELYDRYLTLTPGGDPKVTKWVADLNNRNRAGKSEPHKEKE
jgi:Flp pilus assembly protein TadD